MRSSPRVHIVAACTLLASLLGGCSTLSDITAPVRNLWSGPQEQSRARPGAQSYECSDGKRLTLLFDEPGKAAWVLLPDREYRLDAAPAGGATRYSNGVTTVSVSGAEVSMEESNVVTFSGCKQAGK